MSLLGDDSGPHASMRRVEIEMTVKKNSLNIIPKLLPTSAESKAAVRTEGSLVEDRDSVVDINENANT